MQLWDKCGADKHFSKAPWRPLLAKLDLPTHKITKALGGECRWRVMPSEPFLPCCFWTGGICETHSGFRFPDLLPVPSFADFLSTKLAFKNEFSCFMSFFSSRCLGLRALVLCSSFLCPELWLAGDFNKSVLVGFFFCCLSVCFFNLMLKLCYFFPWGSAYN